MISIRDDLIATLEQRVNRKIQYSSISPSLFGSFDVRNVRIMGNDNHPVLTISRFRIDYSLLDILRGKVQAIHSVWIETPLIDFNTTRDRDLINLFENFKVGKGGNFSVVFPEEFTARIRNGKCLIVNNGDMLELDVLNINLEIADNRIIIDGGWNTGVTIDMLMGSPLSMYVAVKTTGSCRTDMQEGEAVFSIPSITGDVVSVSPVAFGLVLENGFVRLGKMPDQLPFGFSLEYEINEGAMGAQFDCTNFQLHEFISFSERLENIRQLLDIATSGTASFERAHDGSFGYAVDLSGSAFTPPVSGRGYLSYPIDGASFKVNLSGNEERALINTFLFSMPQTERTDAFFFGDIDIVGSVGLRPFAPNGILSLTQFSLSGMEKLNAGIVVNTRDDGEITVFCRTLNLGNVDFAAFYAALRPLGNNMGFTASARRSQNVEYSDEPAGSLFLEGSLNSEARRIEAGLRLDSFSANDITGMALPFVRNASLFVPFKKLLGGGLLNTEISFALSGKDRCFELIKSRFTRNGEDGLSLSGRAEYSGLKDINFLVDAGYQDIEYHVLGKVLDGKSVSIQGSYGLDVGLTMSGGRGYTGSICAEDFPLPFLGHQALLSFMAHLRYDTSDFWSVNLERLELTGIASPAGPAQIRISGGADQRGADFPVLYYRDNIGPLNGRAGISWKEGYSSFIGTADMWNGMESYYAEGSFLEGYFNLVFSGSAMRLERMFGNGVNALAEGELRLSWDAPDTFRAEFNLASLDGKIYDQKFGARAHAVLDSGDLIISSAYFKLAELEGIMPYFIINGAKGTVEARTDITGFAGGRRVEGRLLLGVDFMPIQSWVEIDKMLNSFKGAARVEGWRYGSGEEAQDFAVDFVHSDGALSVLGGPRNMFRFQMDREGNFYAGLSNPFPVRGTVIGSIKDKIIDARCGNLYVDVGELFKLLPENNDFYLTGGYMNASVDIKGLITDPEFFGSARGTSLRIRIPDFLPLELRPIPFNIAIEGNEMTFGPVPVSTGNGAGTVTGWFRFDRWIPNIFSLDIAIPRETPVPYDFDITGFLARGNASGNLNVSMDNMTFDISGELYVNNTEMSINSDEINRNQGLDTFDQTQRPFVVDLAVNTGPVVDFYYPSFRFPILRANPVMGTRLRVIVDSLAEQFSLTSDIRIRGGEIFYFDRNFYIRSGILSFRENELHFSPRLTARAEVRDHTENGPITISMIVENAPLFSFTARFESSPSLSQMEILSLLGQNIGGNQFDESIDSVQRAFISSTSDLLAQFAVVRLLEQQIRNLTRLDMFSVRTQVLQNAFFMATGLMPPPVDRMGIGNYFDNTTVFGGKYIGQDMFIQGMLSMRYDANNPSWGGLTIAPDIGIELQNPLFSIRWDFIPTHPENWYVNDNSITLTWSRSF